MRVFTELTLHINLPPSTPEGGKILTSGQEIRSGSKDWNGTPRFSNKHIYKQTKFSIPE